MEKPKWISWLVPALVVLGAYFLNVEVQSHLGRQVLEKVDLEKNSFADALTLAKTERKLVLADYTAIWCPACRTFDKKVLADPQVQAFIKEGFVFSRLESESDDGVAFAKTYGVRGTPTLVVLNGEGKLLEVLPHTLEPQTFIQMLQRNLSQNKPLPAG